MFFENASTVVLLGLAIIAFGALKNGELGAWSRAKFLNKPNVDPSALPAATPSTGGGMFGLPASLVAPITGGVIGSLTSLFGADRDGGERQHAGVDVGLPIGTPVRSSGTGIVSWAGSRSGYGLTIDVDHGDGLLTRYAHLSNLDVRIGQRVNVGDRIGLSGDTGNVTGPHLHFEVRRNGVPVDPAGLFSTGAVA